MLWRAWERRGQAKQDGFRSTHMKSDWTLWDPLAIDLNSTPSRSMSCGKHHSTMFPAETGGVRLKQTKITLSKSTAQHSTAHTASRKCAVWPDGSRTRGGHLIHLLMNGRGPGGDNGGTPSPASKSVSFEWRPVAVPLYSGHSQTFLLWLHFSKFREILFI